MNLAGVVDLAKAVMVVCEFDTVDRTIWVVSMAGSCQNSHLGIKQSC